MATFTAEQLVDLRRVSSVACSPGGEWLAVAVQRLDDETRSKYVSDLWRVPVDGGEPRQLTRGKWNDTAPRFLHDGSLAFLSNRPTGKDEQHEERAQVFALHPWGGEPAPITDEPLGVSSFKAASEADVLVLTTSILRGVEHDAQRETLQERRKKGPTALVYDDMPVRFWDHWLPEQVPHLIAYDRGERRSLTPDAGRELFRAEWDLSADGRIVALNPGRPGADRIDDQWAEVVDVATAERRRVAEGKRAAFASPAISPDGSSIAMLHHQRRDGAYGKAELVVLDVASGELRRLDTGLDTWLEPAAWTADGREILCLGPLRTHAPVFAVDAQSGAWRRITSEAAGGSHSGIVLVTGASPAVAGVRSTRLSPPEPFVVSLETEAEPRTLGPLSGFEAGSYLVEDAEVVSTDGTPVQYAVLKAAGASGPLPVLNWIHGGPIADWGDVWHWRWNPLVAASRGYLVVLPNPRGSTGFGQAFIEGIWNNAWGGQCYEDLVAVFDAVEQRDDADPSRTIAMGGSFGGYMTNWIGSQTDRFSCLVTHASIFDLAAFHGVTDSPAWWAFTFGVHPYASRPDFDRYSPLAHVENWKSPTLVIHGEMDYRVPIGEALALFEALRFYGVTARLLVFPDENHWILRPRNIVTWYEKVFDFIGEHI